MDRSQFAPDSSLGAPLEGGGDLEPRWVQHADDADERQIGLVAGELGRVVHVHIVGAHGVVGGGEGQAAEGVAAGAVGDGLKTEVQD